MVDIAAVEICMETIEIITRKIQQLPYEKQIEVANFVDFLLSRAPDETDFEQTLNETAGIWKDELDGVAYEDQMRRQWASRGRQQE